MIWKILPIISLMFFLASRSEGQVCPRIDIFVELSNAPVNHQPTEVLLFIDSSVVATHLTYNSYNSALETHEYYAGIEYGENVNDILLMPAGEQTYELKARSTPTISGSSCRVTMFYDYVAFWKLNVELMFSGTDSCGEWDVLWKGRKYADWKDTKFRDNQKLDVELQINGVGSCRLSINGSSQASDVRINRDDLAEKICNQKVYPDSETSIALKSSESDLRESDGSDNLIAQTINSVREFGNNLLESAPKYWRYKHCQNNFPPCITGLRYSYGY